MPELKSNPQIVDAHRRASDTHLFKAPFEPTPMLSHHEMALSMLEVLNYYGMGII